MNEEIVIINNEPFYRILNGTSYDYAPIPKQFKPYFERLQQENKLLKHNWNELKKWLEDENNQKYSQYIYNYSINDWVLNKMQELEEGGNNEC